MTQEIVRELVDGEWVTHAKDVSGGGVGGAGSARVLGPFPFAFDTPGLTDGVVIYTPAVDEILLDAWIEVTSQFDGTTPMADIGTFPDTFGFFGATNTPVDLGTSDDSTMGLLNRAGAPPDGYGQVAVSLTGAAFVNGSEGTGLARVTPGRFVSTDPMLLVVSQDGSKGGDPIGALAGSGAVYLVVATPSLT